MTEPSLDNLIRRFVIRRRRFRATAVFCVMLSLAMAWMLTVGVVDRLVAIGSFTRTIIVIVLLIIMILSLVRIMRLLLGRRFDPLIAARQIEVMTPSLHDRLITVVTQQSLKESQRGSIQITEWLTSEVTATLARQRPENLITNQHIAPALVLLLLMTVIAGGVAFIPWFNMPRLIARQLMPLADIPPVTTTRIDVVTRGLDVPQGQPLALVADVTRGWGAAAAWVGEDDQSLQPIEMSRTFGDRFAVTLPPVDRDLIYRVRCGDAVSPPYPIRLLRKPMIVALRVTLDYPDYLNRPPVTFDTPQVRIEAVRGTRATLVITASEPLKDALLKVDENFIYSSPTADPRIREASLVINNSADWGIDLLSARDVPATGSDTMQVVCLDDRPPLAQFAMTDLRAVGTDMIKIPFQAVDDLGISQLQLKVNVGEKTVATQSLDITPAAQVIRDRATIDLLPYNLAIGQVLTITLVATDSAGQTRSTAPCQVLIAPNSVLPQGQKCVELIGKCLNLARQIQRQSAASRKELEELQQLVRAAIYLSDTPATGSGLKAEGDRVQQMLSQQRWATLPDSDKIRQWADQRVEALESLYEHEQARLAVMDLENIRAIELKRREMPRGGRDVVQSSIARARAQVALRLGELKISPNTSDVSSRLDEVLHRHSESLSNAGGLEIWPIAQAWQDAESQQTLSARIARDRLAWAAEAELLNPDRDLLWWRDLHAIVVAINQREQLKERKSEKWVELFRRLEKSHEERQLNPMQAWRTDVDRSAAKDLLHRWAGKESTTNLTTQERLSAHIARIIDAQQIMDEPIAQELAIFAEPSTVATNWAMLNLSGIFLTALPADVANTIDQSLLMQSQRYFMRYPLSVASICASSLVLELGKISTDLSRCLQLQQQLAEAHRRAVDQSVSRLIDRELRTLRMYRDIYFTDSTFDVPVRDSSGAEYPVSDSRVRGKESTSTPAASAGEYVPPGFGSSVRLYLETLEQVKRRNKP